MLASNDSSRHGFNTLETWDLLTVKYSSPFRYMACFNMALGCLLFGPNLMVLLLLISLFSVNQSCIVIPCYRFGSDAWGMIQMWTYATHPLFLPFSILKLLLPQNYLVVTWALTLWTIQIMYCETRTGSGIARVVLEKDGQDDELTVTELPGFD